MADATTTNDAIKAAANAESSALLAKAVKSAQLALVEEGGSAEETAAATPAAEAAPADDKTVVLKRGPDGKFLKPGEKAPEPKKEAAKAEPAKEAAKKPDAEAKPETAEPEVTGNLAKFRRLFLDGKFEEASKVVGINLEKLSSSQWQSFHAHNKKAKAELEKEKQTLAGQQNEIRNIAQRLQPLLGAQQALAARDFDAFLALATNGEIRDVSAFNKLAIAKLHGSAALDPESQRRLSHAEQRAIAAEQSAKALELRLAQAEQQKALPEKQREYKETTLRNEVELLEENELAALADDPSFIDEVFEVKNQHWNGQSTIGTDAAAAIAHRRWLKKQGESGAVSGNPRQPGAVSGNPRERSAASAKAGARASTTLNSQEAAEAAPAPKLEGKALMDFWVKRAIADRARESA